MNDDFIKIYDNTLTSQECQNFIDYFYMMKSMNLTSRRNPNIEGPGYFKSDESFFLNQDSILTTPNAPIFAELMNKFWVNYNDYSSTYSTLSYFTQHNVQQIRIQKTLPGEGYHVWHFENGTLDEARRITAWLVYLNDVEEGGETEFLYLHKRIKPKAGTMVIWPAGFTHTHRGNPPLTGTKYIISSWTEHN